MMKYIRLTAHVVVLLVAIPVGAYAETDHTAGSADTNRVDRYHRYLSHRVLHVAESINNAIVNTLRQEEDQESEMTQRFFGNLLTAYHVEGSHIRVAPRVVITDRADTKYKLDFSARLQLPGLSDRLRLYADRYDTEYDEMDEIFSARYRQDLDRERSESLTAGLAYFFTDRSERQLSLSSGLHFRPAPSPNVRLKGRYSKTFDVWRADFLESGFWSEKDGFGERTEIVLDRPIEAIHLLRLHSSAVWSEVSHGVDWGQNVSCYTRFSARRSTAITLGARGYTHPSAITDQYLLRVSYRQRVHRDWLFWEIEPGLDFFREDDFKTTPLVTIKLDIIIGDYDRL